MVSFLVLPHHHFSGSFISKNATYFKMVAYLVILFVFIIIGTQASFQDKSSFEFCRYNQDKELITESRRMRDTYSFLHEVKRLVLPSQTAPSQAQTCSGHPNT